jgi:hypothetical protein
MQVSGKTQALRTEEDEEVWIYIKGLTPKSSVVTKTCRKTSILSRIPMDVVRHMIVPFLRREKGECVTLRRWKDTSVGLRTTFLPCYPCYGIRDTCLPCERTRLADYSYQKIVNSAACKTKSKGGYSKAELVEILDITDPCTIHSKLSVAMLRHTVRTWWLPKLRDVMLD